jgi:hypothetical protein
MGKTFKDRKNWERKQERNEDLYERKFREPNMKVSRRNYEEIIDDDDDFVYDEYDLEFE